MANHYALHSEFVKPANTERSLKYVFSIAVIFALVFVLAPILIFAILPDPLNEDIYEMKTPLGSLLSFATFGISGYALVKLVRFFHRRGFWSLIGPYNWALEDLRKVAVAVCGIQFLVQIVLPFGTWGEIAEVRSILLWLALLPFSFLVIFIQVSTEELVFRGYLQQQFACLTDNPWIWMGIPSALFGLIHYWNGNSPPEGFIYAFWAFLLGLACADLTARTGALGAAIGLHFSVNIVAILFVGIQDWPFSGLALVLFAYFDPNELSAEIMAAGAPWILGGLVGAALSVLVMWLAARIAIRR